MKRWLGVVAPVLLVLAACGPDEGAGPSPGGAASSEYWFESLPRMVATSDLVVLGTVVDIQRGIMMGTPPEEIYLLNANLDVDETLYGSGALSALTIQTLQDVPPQPDWRETGNTVLAFMKLSTDPGFPGLYYPVNEQSVYLVAGADLQATTTDDDRLSKRMARMTLDEIRHEIKEAAEAIEAGEVTPQTPFGG